MVDVEPATYTCCGNVVTGSTQSPPTCRTCGQKMKRVR